MAQPQVNVGTVSNVFVRQMHFVNIGDEEMGHAHPHDHVTLLAKGQLNVTVNGEETLFTAPNMIFIKANTEHKLTAASEQVVAYCIHALREETGDIISPEMVPQGVDLYNMISRLTNSNA